MVIGDFNAKTGSGYKDFPYNMGRFGKGHLNSNGLHLLEYAKENQLYLTNTTFQHKHTEAHGPALREMGNTKTKMAHLEEIRTETK